MCFLLLPHLECSWLRVKVILILAKLKNCILKCQLSSLFLSTENPISSMLWIMLILLKFHWLQCYFCALQLEAVMPGCCVGHKRPEAQLTFLKGRFWLTRVWSECTILIPLGAFERFWNTAKDIRNNVFHNLVAFSCYSESVLIKSN